MKLIGIDPGKNGGIAIYDGNEVSCYKMPQTPSDILELFSQHTDAFVLLEKVHDIPGQKGMFTFGKMYGWLEMALISLKIRHTTITPQKWIKEYELGKRDKNKPKSEWKNKLKAKAQALYPNIKVTLWNADALLILEYLRRKEKYYKK